MIAPSRNVYLVCLSFYALLATVNSIKCFQCTSIDVEKSPYQCNEYFDDTELVPESCDDIHNAQYCIKQIGTFEGGLITRRFCSSEYLGNYCHYLQQPGGRAPYRSCYFTCQGDGCNSAVRFSHPNFLFAIPAILFFHHVVL